MKRMSMPKALTGAAAAASLLAVLPGSAEAVNRYTVRANSPKPAVCNNHGTVPAGTWIQNKPCGYYVGMAMSGSSFDVHQTSSSNYHFGRSHGSNNICGWIPPGALGGSPTAAVGSTCSEATKDAMSHRRSFGRDFNAAAHAATDGSPISVNPACGAYYNYYTASSYRTGSLRDPAGAPGAEVRYRFTTNGSNPAVVVRDHALGWVFMDRDCVTDWRGVAFHNDSD